MAAMVPRSGVTQNADGSPLVAPPRRILHVDMNAFFVACELLRRPELAGKPVIVGGSAQRGVVAAASYEARQFGVKSAMPSAVASRLCPQAVFLDGDHDYYGELSDRVFGVFREFTPLVEGLSLDEAFLDVSGAQRLLGDARAIAVRVRETVAARVGLPCSVGIATSKFVAKLATEFAKPRASRERIHPGPGVFEVQPGNEVAFLQPLDVGMLWGVGPVTLEKLHRIGLRTVGDIAASELRVLKMALGDGLAEHLFELSRAVDDRPVEPDRETKSVGSEETFARDIVDIRELRRHLLRMADTVARRCRSQQLGPRTITLKIRYGDFSNVSRSKTLEASADTTQAIMVVVDELLPGIDVAAGIRLAGISARNFTEPDPQLTLFADPKGSGDVEWREAAQVVDRIRERFGDDAIATGSLDESGSTPWGPRRE